MTDEQLDELLTPSPAAIDSREAIFARTLPQLRTVPGSWRQPLIGSCLLLMGFGIGWLMKPVPPPPPPERIIETVIEKVLVPQSVPEPVAERTPDQWELQAEMATDRVQSAKLYQQAGDAYLQARQIESAIRCYRLYLAEAGPAGEVMGNDDSWLLASIKNSKRTEKHHAKADY
ncbi:MAG: hypothetical protein ACRCZF_26585 [Gemmataceae bacterium]